MKLSYLKIKNYLQFSDVEFDFTYPKNHRKAGLPLDKICLIGQSGTGKTVLLKTIEEVIKGLNRVDNLNNFKKQKQINYLSKFYFLEYDCKIISEREVYDMVPKTQNHVLNGGQIEYDLDNILNKIENLLIIIESELLSNSIILFENKNLKNRIKLSDPADKSVHSNEKVLRISKKTGENIWTRLFLEVEKYDELRRQFGNQLINLNSITNSDKIAKSIDEWNKININPRKSIYEICLNPILEKFNLIGDEDDFDSFLALKNLTSNLKIPFEGLSTGTQNFAITSIPLFLTNTKDSIILIDEPERSLFPDIQLEIIDHYVRICSGAQIIIATHSPIIAASFEPCERFILHFDAEGKVLIKQGEAPKGDDPNDLLEKDFEIGYINSYGIEMWEKYRKLRYRYKNEQLSPEEKDRIFNEYTKIRDEYNYSV